MDQRLSLITLGVADLAVARAFYGGGLGWTPLDPLPDVVFYQLPGLALALFGREDLARDVGEPLPGPGGAFTLAINGRSPAEVDRTFARAVAAGARAVKPPRTAAWGGYSGYFADPDGHLWETAYNPGCEITPRGETFFGGR
ncbi:MAG TPA: VOC family protein [Caulobacter sp.]|nr:VOC family protein [Caulobacter sp.]